MVVVAVVSVEFLVGQIKAGKQLVFFEDKIGNHSFLRPRTQIERLQLLETPHQKCELRLKRCAAFAFIKGVKKRIRVRFYHALRIQTLSENARQRALAHADGSFYSNVAGQFEKIGHEFARYLGTGRISRLRLTGNCGKS